MDETKSSSETIDLQPPAAGSSGSSDETKDLSETESLQPHARRSSGSLERDPPQIGRYTILGRLGQGGFGRVYLAYDDDLDRPVAIKVPNPERITCAEDVEAFLVEARILAKLDHPNIVPVFDVGRTEAGLCFVVSKLIEGSDLAVRIAHARPSFRDSAGLVATIADALHYAHTQGLVHRDVKPANILMDASGKPCLADFGLALKDEDFGKGGGLAGTPAFMSPEQARGEGHRVDGRSDIFSLGVVLYQLLTGRRPFQGDTPREIIEQVTQAEARPPRQIDLTIPRELERICLKAMSKRASERYTAAMDMAEDLRLFLQATAGTASFSLGAPGVRLESTLEAAPPAPSSQPSDSDQRVIKIVPKGLRSFDEHDADFFLELLPGARDRDGLPESIRFWKRRIEQIAYGETFRVGLIYGPSGCGKSSLVKAGLLPRLPKHVQPVYIEATSEGTETRLLKGLRKVCPDLPPQVVLVDSLAAIRHGRVLLAGQKVLLVLDQFEQWLHATRGKANTELVAALRQCDGGHVQAVVIVRDDFWMAATSFFDDLETDVILRQNAVAVDLFDPRHAHKVLRALGTAYGKLPERTDDFSNDQHAFLEQAIGDLVQDGKIISVRLSLFAEMLKGKPWTSTTLRDVGGTQGVGLTFLEETLSASTAPPEHRHHQKAAQAVLKALLPETGTDIKGQMRSRQELLDASGYAKRPREFDDLIRILDTELRLITPTDPERTDEGAKSKDENQEPDSDGVDSSLILHPSSFRYYQLAHDYLVHSLREWLGRRQRETRRGRAQLRLAERSMLWNAKPENRYLPSGLEWANIRLLTRTRDWTDPQRKMMRKVETRHLARALLVLFIGLVVRLGMEYYLYRHASTLVEQLKSAETQEIGGMVSQLSTCRRWANPRLISLLAGTPSSSKEHLHASLALLSVDTSQVDYLYQRMLNADGVELSVIMDFLKPCKEQLVPKLWSILDSTEPGTISWRAPPSPPSPSPSAAGLPAAAATTVLGGLADKSGDGLEPDSLLVEKQVMPAKSSLILRIAAILAHYDPANQGWGKTKSKISNELVQLDPVELAYWVNSLRPVKEVLIRALYDIRNDDKRPSTEKNIANVVLRDYGEELVTPKPGVMIGD